MAQRHNTESCDRETALPADTSSDNKSATNTQTFLTAADTEYNLH